MASLESNVIMLRIFIISLLLICSCAPRLVQYERSKTKFIRDSEGRIVIYHAANLSNYAKHSNNGRAGVTWHTKSDFDQMKKDGYNAVRYLVFWEALEPVQGIYDTAYLRLTKNKISEIQASGLDVIVDMHQDLFNQNYGGDGFPIWVSDASGFSFSPNNINWSLNYLSPAVQACFSNFWDSEIKKAAYIQALGIFIQALDTFPGVVGYDIMNEPFPGAALPSKFEAFELSAFYTDALASVRRVSNKLFFFEPWMSTSAGIPSYLTFTPDSLCVYAPHYYNLLCESRKPYLPIHGIEMQEALKWKASEANSWEVPMFLGEFGVSSQSFAFDRYLKDFNELSAQLGFGWACWSYDRQNDNDFGLLNNDGTMSVQGLALQGIYPQRISGSKPSWGFNNKVFTLEYTTAGLRSPTEIYVPAGSYTITVNSNKQTFTGGVFQIIDSTHNNKIHIEIR